MYYADILLLQTRQLIAMYLPSDADVVAYCEACRSTNAAVDGDRLSFWRRRFLAAFERPATPYVNNLVFKQQYQKRRKALLYGAKFEAALKGTQTQEIRKAVGSLEVLRDLIKGKSRPLGHVELSSATLMELRANEV
jgi:hypothetical protein